MAIAIHVDCACDTINSTSTTSPSHAETMMSDRDAITEGLYVPGYLSNPGGWGGRVVRRSPRCSSFERTPRSRLWRPPRASARGRGHDHLERRDGAVA